MVLEATTRHAWLGRLAFAGLLLALLASRLPSPLWTAFWAEDGAVFYADAYNQGGLQALVRPWTGYLQTSGRLVSALLVQFPVAWGPQLATCIALVIDILPAVFLLSHRFQAVIPSFRVRALLALVSIALPDTFELNGNLANTQWHLALLAFLVLVSAPPTRAGWRIVDFGALLLSGLTGVFCLPLAPLAAWLWLRQRSTWRLVATMLLAACALVQGTLLLTHFGQRAGARLQPSLPALLHILDRVLLAPLLSSRGYIHLAASPLWSGIALPLVVGLMGAAAIIYACGRGPLELRLLPPSSLRPSWS